MSKIEKHLQKKGQLPEPGGRGNRGADAPPLGEFKTGLQQYQIDQKQKKNGMGGGGNDYNNERYGGGGNNNRGGYGGG